MNDLMMIGETMTTAEVANCLGIDISTVQKRAKSLFPELVKNGKVTRYNENQVDEIKTALIGNGHLGQLSEVKNITTDIEMERKAMEVMAWMGQKIKTMQEQLLEAQPKIEFFNAVTDSKDAIDMKDAAKVLNIGIGRNTLFQKLRDKKILMENNTPYQEFVDRGYFRVIESKWVTPQGETKISLKTVVYQKGLTFILKKIREIPVQQTLVY